MSLLLLAWALSLCFPDQQERRVRCLDMLFVLLGAFPLINNWEPSDNNMLGHPANYNTAAYKKQNVRGAHGNQWRWWHKGLLTAATASMSLAGPAPASRATVPPVVGGRDLYPAEQWGSEWRRELKRATGCWGEVMAQHIQALTTLWRQINSYPLSIYHYPIVVPHPTSTGDARR